MRRRVLALLVAPAGCYAPPAATCLAPPCPDGGSPADGDDGAADGVAPTGCARQVAAGALHSCALLTNGSVVCWGANDEGQLGDGGTTGSAVPVRAAPLPRVDHVLAGAYHTCARADTAVWCWGANDKGQLGDGTTIGRGTPAPVMGISSASWIAVGDRHACAVDGGAVKCWGANGWGQLGDATTSDRAVPVTAIAQDATAVAAGADHTCAITSGAMSTLRCWGENTETQLGLGTMAPALVSSPTDVPGVAGAAAVTAGSAHTCALRAGLAWCWGRGDEGQLGDGGRADQPEPVQVWGARVYALLGAGGDHTCGVDDSGGARCWGRNGDGELGDGTLVDRDNPTAVADLGPTDQIAAGLAHTCAVTSGGEAFCWGRNTSYQLGNTGGGRPTPVPVSLPCR